MSRRGFEPILPMVTTRISTSDDPMPAPGSNVFSVSDLAQQRAPAAQPSAPQSAEALMEEMKRTLSSVVGEVSRLRKRVDTLAQQLSNIKPNVINTPQFTTQELEAVLRELASRPGANVLVVGASWCPMCTKQLQMLTEMNTDKIDSVTVLYLDSPSGSMDNRVEPMVKKMLFPALDLKAIPVTLIVRKDSVKLAGVGFMPAASFLQQLDS